MDTKIEKKLRGMKLVGTITGPDKTLVRHAEPELMRRLASKLPMTFKSGRGKKAVTLTIAGA